METQFQRGYLTLFQIFVAVVVVVLLFYRKRTVFNPEFFSRAARSNAEQSTAPTIGWGGRIGAPGVSGDGSAGGPSRDRWRDGERGGLRGSQPGLRGILKVPPSQHSGCFYQSQQREQQKGRCSSPQTPPGCPATWKGQTWESGKGLLGAALQTQEKRWRAEAVLLSTCLI